MIVIAILGLLLSKKAAAYQAIEVAKTDTQAVEVKTYVWHGRYNQAAALTFLQGVLKTSTAPVLKATVYSNQQDALENTVNKGSTDISKSFWETECNRRMTTAKEAIQIVRVGNRECLQGFGKQGAWEQTFPGKMPLSVKMNETTFRFLDMGVEYRGGMLLKVRQLWTVLYYQCPAVINSATGTKFVDNLNLPEGNFKIQNIH